MPTVFVEGDAAVTNHQLSDAQNGAMNFGMLENKVKILAIVLAVHYRNLTQIGYKRSISCLVFQPPSLSIAFSDGVTREGLGAVGDVGF